MARNDGGEVRTTGAEQIAPEDLMRAQMYLLIANLLRATPDPAVLTELAGMQSDDSEMGRALATLGAAAEAADCEAIDDEFHALFLGVGGSELQPYASYYLTGFIYEKPLAKLRAEMAELGIARTDDNPEPEDHIASLFEMMGGMIVGGFGGPVALSRQRDFFDQHIAPWAERFFEDLEASPSVNFYRPVGGIGRLFMAIESQSFEMAA